jgi:hypothetical protein
VSFRTTRSSVSFNTSFRLKGVDDELPAGSYEIETDEEIIETTDRTAYRRIATLIHIRTHALTRSCAIDPRDLEAALERDRRGRLTPANDGPAPLPPGDKPWRSIPLWVANTPAPVEPRPVTDINHALAQEQIAPEKSAAAPDETAREEQDEIAWRHGDQLRESGFPHRPYRAPSDRP